MKLVIFGATGKTGIPLVQKALDEGHVVVAFVRDPAKMTIKHARLTLVQGDVLNEADVAKALPGADAVLSTLGRSKQSPKDMHANAIRNIITGMKKQKIRRLVSLTGAGVDAPQDQPQVINHIIKFALKTLSGEVLKDAQQHVELIKESGLDWVIVRGPMLNEKPPTGKYRVGWVGVNTGARISRGDVADFMLKEVTDTTYLHQMPMVSD